MDDTITKQLILFENIKDKWYINKEAIIECIVITEEYDGDIAMNMWQYILQSNIEELHYKPDFVNDILLIFSKTYNGAFPVDMIEHVVPHLIKNDSLMELIFKETKYCGKNHYISVCIAGIILSNDTILINRIINFIDYNHHIYKYSIAKLLLATCDNLHKIIRRSNIRKVKIDEKTIDFLLSKADIITNIEEYAEYKIYLISLCSYIKSYYKQVLLESFDVLKSLWIKKKEALSICIFEIHKYDVEMSLTLWQYILQFNINDIHYDISYVDNVLERFCENDMNYFCDKIIPYLIENDKLLELIFSQTKDCGYGNFKISNIITDIIIRQRPSSVDKIMSLIRSNNYFINYSMGSLLVRVLEDLYYIKNKYKIDTKIKDILQYNINLIKDDIQRAECNISLTSIY